MVSVEVHFSCFESKYSFNGLYSAPRPFLLTLTTVNVETTVNVDIIMTRSL